MSRARDLANFASDSQINAGEIEDSAVTTAKIADSAITVAKISDGAVHNVKLANSTITMSGDSGSDSVALGETMTVAGGTGITSTGSSNTITIAIDSTVATLTGTQTLTNKTINTASNTITIVESDISDLQSYILADSTDTLTNKTISGSSNTLSNIGNASLTNSSITVTDGSTSTAVSLGGTITIQGTTNEIEVSESSGTVTIGLPSDTTIGNNLTIAGNLTVNGTTTTLNTTNTTVTDNLLELNSGATSNANDSGILIERGTTGDNAIMAWDESADQFIFGTTTATASDTGNLTITAGDINVGGITTTGITSTGNINLGDNDRLRLGASQDLQIYHDVSGASIIEETGGGDLTLRGTNLNLQNSGGTKAYLVGTDSTGSVQLRYGNSPKLDTTSTGIDVTGSIEVGTNHTIGDDANLNLELTSATNEDIVLASARNVQADLDHNSAGGTRTFAVTSQGLTKYHLLINTGGDISFYEDTGTTAKFFWDASAENLGIGTTSPVAPIDAITNSTVYAGRFIQSNTTNGDGLLVQIGSTASSDYALTVRSDGGNTSGLAVKADGKVGIGTFTPGALLDLEPNPSGTSGVYLAQRIRGHTSTQLDRGLNTYLERAGGGSIKHIIAGGTYDGTNYYKAQYTSTTIVERFDEQSYKIYTSPDATNSSTTTPTTAVKEKLGIQYNQVVFNEASEDVDFRVESNNNANMFFVDGGNDRVGIGTSSPSYMLEVAGPIKAASGTTAGLRVHTNSGITASNNYQNFFTSQSNGWSFNANGTGADSSQQVKITPAGTVRANRFNVGTDATNELLDLRGSGHSGHGTSNTRGLGSFAETQSGNSAGVWIGSRIDQNTGIIGTRTASGNLAFETYSGGWGERMRLTNTGRLGIGTSSPNRTLSVAGNIELYNDNTDGYIWFHDYGTRSWSIGHDQSTGYFNINYNSDLTANPRISFTSSGDMLPATTNAQDLGSSSKVWRNIYTSDFHMSNEGLDKGNDIDGTKGSWTFQEGENDLFLINNKNGKKYKFKLEEIV